MYAWPILSSISEIQVQINFYEKELIKTGYIGLPRFTAFLVVLPRFYAFCQSTAFFNDVGLFTAVSI